MGGKRSGKERGALAAAVGGLFAAVLVWPVAATAAGAAPHAGFSEVVLVVRDLEGASRFYQDHAHYAVMSRGRAEAGAEAGLAGPAATDEIVLGLSGTPQGYVRLLRAEEAGASIRDGARPFDHGGFMDVNARVKDLDAAYRDLTAADACVSYSQPLQYGFKDVVVKEVLLHCHDGVNWALLERVAPPVQGLPPFDRWSYATNATITVADYAAARRFFVDQLGFAVQSELLQRKSPAPGTNILGLPDGVAMETARDVGIFGPPGAAYGTVEVLSFGVLKGRDVTARAAEPRRGIAAVRFEVDDVDRFARDVAGRGLQPAGPTADVVLRPYGRVRLVRFAGPEATRIEFFSRLGAP